ncbi:hypothetical protein [Massilia soli]|uniref:Uncharacterized protein n=1 Tax=Massilia soli TaxID=2792854 RepID=A0ABS7SKF8_9BURK|nr:hypothetical protein [Massilia soli]
MATSKWYSHPVIAAGIAVNAFILALAVAWSGPDPTRLWRLLGEDGIVEWMQFLCFAVLSAMLGFVASERWKRAPRISLELLALVGLSALTALAALEEISWFQRILNVQSPEFFLQNNRQAETNLHNLALGSASLHKTVLLKLIFIVGITHNLILPLLARSRPAVKTWVESMGLYLPPLRAAVAYLVLVILSHLLIEHPRKGELGEMFGAVHYLATVFTAYFIGVAYGKPPVFENAADARRVSTLFVIVVLFLLMLSWLLSAGAGAVGAPAA